MGSRSIGFPRFRGGGGRGGCRPRSAPAGAQPLPLARELADRSAGPGPPTRGRAPCGLARGGRSASAPRGARSRRIAPPLAAPPLKSGGATEGAPAGGRGRRASRPARPGGGRQLEARSPPGPQRRRPRPHPRGRATAPALPGAPQRQPRAAARAAWGSCRPRAPGGGRPADRPSRPDRAREGAAWAAQPAPLRARGGD